jgi:hypothetical protein
MQISVRQGGVMPTAKQRELFKTYSRLRRDWRRQISYEVGPKKLSAFVRSARSTIDLMGENEELDYFLRLTGTGDHPAFLKLCYAFARHINPELPKIRYRRLRKGRK